MNIANYIKNKEIKFDTTRVSNFVWSIIRAVLIIGISYIILFPILSKLSTTFMAEQDLFDRTVKWIPKHFTFKNIRLVWEAMDYPTAFMNSLFFSLGISLLQLMSSLLVGYGFARFNFKGRGVLFALVIFTLIVPPQVIMIPMYLNFRYFNIFGLIPGEGLNLLNSYWPFILLSITGTGLKSGLFIYIMRQYFKGMPRVLEEAAYVDGAGLLKTFFKVMLPGAVPVLVIVFLFAFVWQWNDDYLVSMFLRDGNLLGINLSNLIIRVTKGKPSDISSQYMAMLNNTGSLLFMAPLLILYLFMQKYFIESVERTGIVG